MKPLGIDLGTTYSAVAVVRDDVPEILDGDDGRLTPSAVFFESGQPLVGSLAKNMAVLQPTEYVDFVKRRMGTREPAHVDEDGREYPPEEVSAIILAHLVKCAAKVLDQEVRDVVITVPAYFDDAARTATKDAAEIAGLRVLRLINEPTAAGVAYGLLRDEDGLFLVYDLGGGTFDVTIMKVVKEQIDVVATEGNRALGGFDFDNILMNHVATAVLELGGPDLFDSGQLEAQLRGDCEDAKRRLSQLDKTVVRVPTSGRIYQVPITRAEFEELTASLLARTEDVIEQVLAEAQLRWQDIDRVLLVGGSSRMPMVADMLTRISGQRPRVDINPDEAVALGAALYADTITTHDLETDGSAPVALQGSQPIRRTVVKDVTSHGMGTVAYGDDGILYNTIIIPKNSSIPCDASELFETREPNQRRLDFEVTQGDSEVPGEVKRIEVDAIDLPPGLPQGSPLRVSMHFDIDGIMHVGVFDETNQNFLGRYHINRAENMTAAEKAEKLQLMVARESSAS